MQEGRGREGALGTKGNVPGRETTDRISPDTLASLRPAGKQRHLLILSPLPPDALSLDTGSPGHWGESRVPAGILPPAPFELSSVGTLVHRLKTAFQEALDLYHLVSQAPGSRERAEGTPGDCLAWVPDKVGTPSRWSPVTR